MINFADVMTRIYSQIAEVKNLNLLPYYMFVSQDIYSELQKEIPLRKEDEGIPVYARKIEFFEDLELVVFHNSDLYEDYILVKGIKVAVA